MEIDELYQEQILDHAKRSAYRGEIEPCSSKAILRNPLCGDEVEVFVQLSGEMISQVRFAGQGCIISQAAASMVSSLVEGKSMAEAKTLIASYRELLLKGGKETSELGELVCLKSVGRFPARIRCALLAAEAVLQAIR